MSQPLPPPIGANRVDDRDDDLGAPSDLRGPSARARLIVAAIVLVVAVVAGVVGYRIVASDDASGGSDLPSWNAVAVQDIDDGITIYDPAGDELDSFETGIATGPPESSGQYLLLPGDDSARIVDATDATVTDVELGDGENARFLAPPSPVIVVSAPASGNVRLIDPANDVEIDVADVASLDSPRIIGEAIRTDLERDVVGVVDEQTFQSVIISLEPDTEPVFVPGRLVDLRHGTALTVQVVGDRAEMTFRDGGGERLGDVEVPDPLSTVLTDAHSALVVTTGGDLLEISATREEPRRLADLDTPEDGGFPGLFLPDAERFVYESAGGETVIVDWSGDEVLRAEGALRSVASSRLEHLACVAVAGAGSDDPTEDAPTQLYDVETGDEVGDSFATVSAPTIGGSLDGCVGASTTPDGSFVASEAGTVSLDGELAGLSLDGSAYLERDDDGVLVLRRTDGDGDPVELAEGGAGAFVQR